MSSPATRWYAGLPRFQAAWNVLQLKEAGDFIIGSGEAHSVREFLEESFRQVGLNAYDFVEFDPRLKRPGKTSTLIADYSKAKKAFGFEPKTKYKDLIKMLIDHDKEEVLREKSLTVQEFMLQPFTARLFSLKTSSLS